MKSSKDGELRPKEAELEPYVRYLNSPEYASDFSSLRAGEFSHEEERRSWMMMSYFPFMIAMIALGCFLGFTYSSGVSPSDRLARLGNSSLGD